MILYHPMFDIFHTLQRLLYLLNKLEPSEYELKKIQVLDFYILFPSEIKRMSFPRDLSLFKQASKKIRESYSKMSNARTVLKQIEPLQLTALRIMASRSLIDPELLKLGYVKKKVESFAALPIEIRSSEWVDMAASDIVLVLSHLPLNGNNGLKKRSGLFEYRYDHE